MFTLKDIKAHEMIKVLVNNDGVEEEFYAKVLKQYDNMLVVTYLCDTSKVYKSATVYSFESTVNTVELESISEYHEGVIDVAELGMVKVANNSFVYKDEIDDDDESYIADYSDEEDSMGSLRDFIVDSDEEVEQPVKDETLERQWNDWEPKSRKEKRFKQFVDNLEEKYHP